jgi:hypothetical protein
VNAPGVDLARHGGFELPGVADQRCFDLATDPGRAAFLLGGGRALGRYFGQMARQAARR